jgi:23S rRNA G2445 N2-methylase RlmL
LAQRNVAANGFDDRIRILRDDIVKMPPVLAGSFDHVVSNPPYPLRNRHKAARQSEGLWRILAKVWRLAIGLNRQCGRQNREDGSALFAGLIGRMN